MKKGFLLFLVVLMLASLLSGCELYLAKKMVQFEEEQEVKEENIKKMKGGDRQEYLKNLYEQQQQQKR